MGLVGEQEQLLKKKAEYIEKLKNKIALVHKSVEEKSAITGAKPGDIFLPPSRWQQNVRPLEVIQRNQSLDVSEVEDTRFVSLVIKVV
uniref:Uncharacterized protein n=1 Tax=Solanum lycopersicum TaxID=4081 RepID=A0A3Q7GUE4_SOLLC